MNASAVENLVADVVIIGGGGAGLAAALSASEHGCKDVVVLEKAGIGGNSAMAHDVFGVESPVQRRMGVDARKDVFFDIAMRWAHWSRINPRIVRAFIDKSGDTIRWLLEKGVRFELGQYYINQSPRVRHTIDGYGAELMKILANKCREAGVRLLTQAPAKKILRDEDGKVTGVIAETDGKTIMLATRCVIIASGGYGMNPEFLKKNPYYNPKTMANANHGARGNRGDGIVMALEVGAATEGIGNVMFHGPQAPMPSALRMKIGDARYPPSVLVREPQTIWLNKRGRRFIDEGFNLSSFGRAAAVAQQPDAIMFTVFDSRTLQSIEQDGMIWPGAYGGQRSMFPQYARPLAGEPLPGLVEEFRRVAQGNDAIMITDSLDELADFMGAKPAVLRKSIEEHNAACAQGRDPVFGKDRRYLLPVATTPYCAIRAQVGISDAIGGVKINENMEVVDANDDVIPGLYAAGSTTGGWETENYCYELTGHLLGFALNSGRIAGENAAKCLRDTARVDP